MGNLKRILGNTLVAAYFIFPFSIILLVLLLMPLLFLMDVNAIMASGFAGPNLAASFIGVSGLFIGLSLLIPPLRKIYRVFPWLFPFVKIFFINFVILNIGLAILNFGYEISNEARHTTFFVLMIVQLVICRLGMSIYFRLRPVHKRGKVES